MLGLHTVDEERQVRIRVQSGDGRDSVVQFERIMRERCEGMHFQAIQHAFDFARNVPYDHPGLSRGAYLAHPLRLGEWALMIEDPPDVQMGTIALLHNLYEVSEVQYADVVRAFGAGVAAAIASLTVDRSQREHVTYRQRYYQGLRDAGHRVCVVKVLDKLDNLFLLCLNPDDAMRTSYLQEVEDFVIPLAAAHVKECVSYLHMLVRQCRADGHIPLERLFVRFNMTAT